MIYSQSEKQSSFLKCSNVLIASFNDKFTQHIFSPTLHRIFGILRIH